MEEKIMRKIKICLVLFTFILLLSLGKEYSVSASQGKGDWNESLFEVPSDKYHHDLARVAAVMSMSAGEYTSAIIKKCYTDYGLKDIETYNYGEKTSAAFSIANGSLKINGKNTLVLVITARGTKTLEETIGDVMKGPPFSKDNSFLGTSIWNNIYDFEEKIHKGLTDYLNNKYSYLKDQKRIKVLITGHSLGGAVASAYAARLNQEGLEGFSLTKKDIYAYTFGAIKVLTKNINLTEGYENIHNIYNYYDSFGPNGINFSWTNASSIYAKFGHTILYKNKHPEEIMNIKMDDNLIQVAKKIHRALSNCTNHLVESYYSDLITSDLIDLSAKKMGLLYKGEKIDKKNRKKKVKKNWKVGNIVTLGKYEQDGNTKNGKEKVEWIVLDKNGNKALLLSKKILDINIYHRIRKDVNWKESSIREWLNNDFYNKAFSNKEKKNILKEKNVFDLEYEKVYDWEGYSIEGDRVFLLSMNEVTIYLNNKNKDKRKAELTDFCFEKLYDDLSHVYSYLKEKNIKTYHWWLRSGGFNMASASYIYLNGVVNDYGNSVQLGEYGIRPAMWVRAF